MEYRFSLVAATYIVFCLATGRVSSRVSPEPHHTSGGVGGEIVIPCGYTGNQIFQWTEFITNPQGNVIFTHPTESQPANSEKYEIEGQYYLRVKNLSLYDGGYYGCRDMSMPQVNRVQMVVLETPTIETGDLVEGIPSTVTCHGRYGGPEIHDSNFVDMIAYVNGVRQDNTAVHIPAQPGPQETYKPGELTLTFDYTLPYGRTDTLRCKLETSDPNFDITTSLTVGEISTTQGSNIYTTRHPVTEEETTTHSDETSGVSVTEVSSLSRFLAMFIFVVLCVF